jgi:hypothetical protein
VPQNWLSDAAFPHIGHSNQSPTKEAKIVFKVLEDKEELAGGQLASFDFSFEIRFGDSPLSKTRS